jgi:hypothetical protein
MSKSANDTLFGITLTELVIILFFIMLLLAMANIEELTERIPDNEEDVLPASTVTGLLFPDGTITSDFAPIRLIKEEIKRLQNAAKELEKMKQLTENEGDGEGEGDGDCKEGGNWINSKCADYCWAIENDEAKRPYDLLVDVGVCNSHVVVQRSNWLEKAEVDFQVVDGAWAAADQQKMSQADLYTYLDIIKEPGFLQEPKQCFHVVRVIDLGAKSVDAWNKNLLYVQERVSTETLTSGTSYERVKASFPTNACALPTSPKQELFKVENSESTISKSINRIAPKINQLSFQNNFQNHRSCRGIRSNKITPRYKINLDETGKVTAVSLASDLSTFSRNQKTLDKITREALMRTSFSPESIEGVALETEIILPITLEKNACFAR